MCFMVNKICACTACDLFLVKLSVFTVTPSKIKVQTIQYRNSRIWEMKEDKYTKSFTKNQVCAIFHMWDIRKNVLPKFIKLCMEMPYWCPFNNRKAGCGIEATICSSLSPLFKGFLVIEQSPIFLGDQKNNCQEKRHDHHDILSQAKTP